MHMDDMILVSIDDHLAEPPDMFQKQVSPASLADVDTTRMPRSEWRQRNEAAGIGLV